MNTGRAFVDGLIAAAVVSGVMFALRLAGLPLDIESRMAAFFGTSGWVVGVALYVLIGGFVALAYAAIFDWVLHQSGIGIGLLLGAYNTILAGFIWSLGSDPGRFWLHFGAAGIASLFLVHLVYGAVLGSLYRTKHTLEYW